ncbi:hypothetical protein P3342_007878 [Pyrenophora teres f. teres]|uniref:Uncharacterized protein n=1 Tax=Pyrenophora teres f. teres TaxID=97479 RepID=A0A6S6W2R4_9PLEO|nr:hypothetical protein HRS9122_09611 [Pyrenophora teres f. teres]KAE8839234.1 hypothetical protein HRS9139_03617 [Pyrenophora teres f. teres]KAE8845198.1 hypothetical protein PTNB85_03463 [Pyrenophora teres f. teres]KAE8865655.1 hypothetical protein PTNB29_02802 [Pyrenophora teres f. teres]KAE8871289.1 hypothetical protein PTNB73_02748 [Pyrenophora teres f. teres]
MFSTTDATLKMEPRFSEYRLIEIGRMNPHAKFENANNLTALKIRDVAYPGGARLTDQELREGHQSAQAITDSAMKVFQATIEPVFDILVNAKKPICKFMLLGMGAVYIDQGPKSHWEMVQYALARQLIKHYITKHATKYHNCDERGQLWEYEVVVDHSQLTLSDISYLEAFFNEIGPIHVFGRKSTYNIRFLHAPLAHLLVSVDLSNTFVFCFKPDNPIRQLLAERPGKDKPQAIICAPGDIDNEARHPSKDFAADMSSDSVRDWLAKGYTTVPFTQDAGLSCSPFGTTCFFYNEKLAKHGYGSEQVGPFGYPVSADSLVVIREQQEQYAKRLFGMHG